MTTCTQTRRFKLDTLRRMMTVNLMVIVGVLAVLGSTLHSSAQAGTPVTIILTPPATEGSIFTNTYVITDGLPSIWLFDPAFGDVNSDTFTVTATSPMSNGLIIARNGIISATFSRAVDGSTVNTRTFTVRGGQTGVYEGVYTFSSVQFDAINGFKSGEEIVVNLSRDIEATDGSSLVPYAWQFRAAVGGGSGIFTDSGQIWPWFGSNSLAVALGDVDGDGDLDAFVTSGPANEIWLNDGMGTFSDSGQSLGSSLSTGVALGDVDGDDDLDAFVANDFVASDDGANKVWLNDGTGTFSDSGQSLGSSHSEGVALGDVDGDGDLDAFVTNGDGANKVWLNDGTGTFGDSGQSLGSSYSKGVALGDVDGDGDLDAFVANGLSQANSKVWLNDGTGVFSDSGQSLSSSYGEAVALGDVDGDGDLDAFVVCGADQANTVWLNDATGTFSNNGQSLGNSDSNVVALGDVDSDGDLDAFVANSNGQANKVWLNDGTGTFSDSGQSLGASSSRAVALGDVDGDSDLDAFVGNYGGTNEVWLNDATSTINTPPALSNLPDKTVPVNGNADNAIDLWSYADDAEDADADLIFSIVNSPIASAGVTIDSNRYIDINPTPGWTGVTDVEVQVQDTGGLTDTDIFQVTPTYLVHLPLMMKHWPPIPDTPVLSAINNPDGDGSYIVDWNAAELAETYTLQEDDNAAFSSPTTPYTGPATSWTASDKPPGTYYYHVRASNAWGDSDWSNVQSVTVTVSPSHEWASLSTGITETLEAVYFVDTQNGWVAGADGAILHTTDGGQSWQRQNSGTTDDLRDMFFLDLNRGWIVGGKGLILRTTDGGNNWETQESPRDTFLESIHFTDEDHGWIAGGYFSVSCCPWRFIAYGYVLRSTDGGDSWSLADYISHRYALDLHFVDETHGWLVTEHIDNSTYNTIPKIYVTSDGGSTWTNQSIPLSTGELEAVTFVDVNTGWAVGGDGIILHTTNGGALWSQQGSGVTSSLKAVQFVSPTVGWIVGSILHTMDGGKTWASQSADPACTELRDLHFVGIDHGWAVGASGAVCKYH